MRVCEVIVVVEEEGEHHPLIIYGATVLFREPRHPGGAVGGHPVGHIAADPGQHGRGHDAIQQSLVEHAGIPRG